MKTIKKLAELSEEILNKKLIGKSLSVARLSSDWSGVWPVCQRVRGGLRIVALRRDNDGTLDIEHNCYIIEKPKNIVTEVIKNVTTIAPLLLEAPVPTLVKVEES